MPSRPKPGLACKLTNLCGEIFPHPSVLSGICGDKHKRYRVYVVDLVSTSHSQAKPWFSRDIVACKSRGYGISGEHPAHTTSKRKHLQSDLAKALYLPDFAGCVGGQGSNLITRYFDLLSFREDQLEETTPLLLPPASWRKNKRRDYDFIGAAPASIQLLLA